MHNTRNYCYKLTNSTQDLEITAQTSSVPVIQQRGNVIVSRFNNNDYQQHQLSRLSISNADVVDEDEESCRPKNYIDLDTHHVIVNRYSPQIAGNHSELPSASSAILTKTDKIVDNDDNNKTDNNNSLLDDSGRRKETIERQFTCDHCQKTFRHKSYYEYHLRTHTGERPFQCNMCEKGFFERSKLNRHLSSCHNIKSGIYVDGDNAVQKSNECPKCNKSFSRSSGLQAHMLTHEGSRPFTCKICKKKFSGLTGLKNHEKMHQGVKSIVCEICGKVFLLKKYLDLHLKTTHKREPRKHCCSSCRKDFHSEKDLKRHQLMHSNAKSFNCTICQTAFKRRDNLHRHLKLTHLLTAEQINEGSGNCAEKVTTSNSDGLGVSNNQEQVSEISTLPPPPPITRQVSVIKSTHEVMMSITRGQQLV